MNAQDRQRFINHALPVQMHRTRQHLEAFKTQNDTEGFTWDTRLSNEEYIGNGWTRISGIKLTDEELQQAWEAKDNLF